MAVSKKEISPCPIDAMLSVIDGRWKGTILWRLLDRPMRTSELARSIPQITERMLIRHLKELTDDGILVRQYGKGRPASVQYSISEYGMTMLPAMEAICAWGRKHLARQQEYKEVLRGKYGRTFTYSRSMPTLPVTEREIDVFLAAFEAGTLPKEEWTHAAHLLTGACYVHAMERESALNKMRECVRRHNVSVGGKNTETSGYHETITVMWIRLLDRLRQEVGSMERAAFAALAVERFEPRRAVFREYYDFDVVASTDARLRWVEPTLKQLD